MLTKRKGDKVPDDARDDSLPDYPSVERWLANGDIWRNRQRVYVGRSHFLVDRESGCLYVEKTADTATAPWVGGYVTLRRIHDGWLRAEYEEGTRFKVGDATKHYQLVNILYKLVKVDNTIPKAWWND